MAPRTHIRRFGPRDRPYPAPGTYTTTQVQARLGGMSYRQLNYARTNTRLAELLGPKIQRHEWPDPLVRKLEIATAISQAVPSAHRSHSNLPHIVSVALDLDDIPDAGWAFYEGTTIVIADHPADLPLEKGGIVLRIPAPWDLAVEEARAPRQRGWAIVEER